MNSISDPRPPVSHECVSEADKYEHDPTVWHFSAENYELARSKNVPILFIYIPRPALDFWTNNPELWRTLEHIGHLHQHRLLLGWIADGEAENIPKSLPQIEVISFSPVNHIDVNGFDNGLSYVFPESGADLAFGLQSLLHNNDNCDESHDPNHPGKAPGHQATFDALLHWVQACIDGQLAPTSDSRLASGETAAESPADPEEMHLDPSLPIPVSASTFDRVVLNPDQDVLLLLYSDMCGACHDVLPAYNQLARRVYEKNLGSKEKVNLSDALVVLSLYICLRLHVYFSFCGFLSISNI